MIRETVSLRAILSLPLEWWRWWTGELASLSRLIRPRERDSWPRFEASRKAGLSLVGDEKRLRRGGPRNIRLCFGDNALLYRKIKLPAATRKNIDKVVGYEFHKYFPMNAEQAIFSCHVVDSGAAGESIEVGIWAVSRELVDDYLGLIRGQYGIEIGRLAITGTDGEELISWDVLRSARGPGAGGILAGRKLDAVLLILLAVVLFYPLLKLAWLEQALRGEIEALEQTAGPVIEVREKIRAAENRFGYLVERKQANPDQAHIWSRVTAIVSNRAILERLKIQGNHVELEGKAPSVESLIHTLEADDAFTEVNITGPVDRIDDNLYETMKISMTVAR